MNECPECGGPTVPMFLHLSLGHKPNGTKVTARQKVTVCTRCGYERDHFLDLEKAMNQVDEGTLIPSAWLEEKMEKEELQKRVREACHFVTNGKESIDALRAWVRIVGSLEENDHWTEKRLWQGYLLALVTHDIITDDEYRWLRDEIECYKGDKDE